ncbi:MAG TPA: hypothetical protein DCY55_09510 [Gammaproteobacteria bacterium]|nr:hypothetical protein [Gammaproteobacteria bacterium]
MITLKAGRPLYGKLNARFGRDSIGLGLSPKGAKWRMRQERLSPRYTTRWCNIPYVQIE